MMSDVGDTNGSSGNVHCAERSTDVRNRPVFKTPNSTDSPVTELAKDLRELTTCINDHSSFPRRKLSLSGCTPGNTPSSIPSATAQSLTRQLSVDEGCSVDSPPISACDSPFLLYSLSGVVREAPTKHFNTLPIKFRGCGPSPRCTSSPASYIPENKNGVPGNDQDESSQDSGVGVEFSVQPRGCGVHPSVFIDRTNLMERFLSSGRRNKAVFKRSLSSPLSDNRVKSEKKLENSSLPKCNVKSLLLWPVRHEDDDGFAELLNFGRELQESRSQTKSCVTDESRATVLCRKRRRDEAECSVTEKLTDVGQAPLPVAASPCIVTPKSSKQYVKRAKECDDLMSSCEMKSSAKKRLVRCQSEAVIHHVLAESEEHSNLVGDFSRPHCLPMLPCAKHQDLKSISPDTMALVLNNKISNASKSDCFVVDCRYPYEYDAGHLQGARNIYTKDGIFDEFLKDERNYVKKDEKIIIFHCEFSSERGPKLMRFLRNKDRDGHRDCYPTLLYPECYLLEGGYRAFYESYPELCEPCGYRSMVDPSHAADLKHFRCKSRSWPVPTNDEARRHLRARSCLKL